MSFKNVVLTFYILAKRRYMQLFTEIKLLQHHIKSQKLSQKTIGFVPTMGTLHSGHISLLEQSKAENDLTICSIYINPTQFTNQEDLENYPRKLEDDKIILEKSGCDILFAPSDMEMYPSQSGMTISFDPLEKVMEGKFRKGHFSGVALIIAKFFNIIQPDKAYFGQKDIQQYFIVAQLVKELFFPVQLKCIPTVREEDGLAMSSRNRRLTPALRKKAPKIHEALIVAGELLRNNQPINEIKGKVRELFSTDNDFQLEYFEIADGESLELLEEAPPQGKVVICIAIYLGKIRLIDNVFLFL